MQTDDIRLLIMATAQSLFPVLAILGVVELDTAEIATVMVLINNLVLLGARVFRKGQQAGPTTAIK